MSNANTLKEIFNEYSTAYASYAEESRAEAMRTLPAGAPAPDKGKILDQFRRDAFTNKAADLRGRAVGIIDTELKAVDDKLCAAPSTEAVNVVQMLAAKKTTTPEEINNLLERYGDNNLTHDAIKSIAAEKGVRVYGENPLYKKADSLRALKKSFETGMNLHGAERGQATAGYTAFVGMMIDNAFND